MKTMNALAMRLRVLRAQSGMTMREVERASGVAKETLSALELGRRRPHDSTLAKLAAVYGVPVDDLLSVGEEQGAGKDSAPPETGLPEALTEQLVEEIRKVQNHYRSRRVGLELLCERWERQLDSLEEDLTRERLDEMSLVGSYVTDFFVQAAVEETVEIWDVLSSATPRGSTAVVDSAAIATAIRSSSMKPVLDRWERLGGEIYRRGVERFGEDAARNAIRLGDPARPTASVDELALRRAQKLHRRAS